MILMTMMTTRCLTSEDRQLSAGKPQRPGWQTNDLHAEARGRGRAPALWGNQGVRQKSDVLKS